MKPLEKLISIASGALNQVHGEDSFSGKLGEELLSVLRLKSGFYAFEGALHFFPGAKTDHDASISEWNADSLWRHEYAGLADGLLFFAEDAFGNQFCIQGDSILSFDAETAQTEPFAENFEEWAEKILGDYPVLTGHPLLREWQLKNGGLPLGMRLIPKIPFVLGGDYKLDNLFKISAVSGMRTRGNLARQFKDLPDGAQVSYKVVE